LIFDEFWAVRIAKKRITIALSTSLLVVIAGLAYGYFELSQAMNRPDLQQNAIAKYIKGQRWGTVVSLIPEPFAPNGSRADIERRLADAGFTRHYHDPLLAYRHPELYEQSEVYSREGGNLVCNIQLYAFVSFDEAGALVSADGTQYERGCL
jgi:hypothetical protein